MLLLLLLLLYLYSRFLRAHIVESESSGKAASFSAKSDAGDKLFFLAKQISSGGIQVRSFKINS